MAKSEADIANEQLNEIRQRKRDYLAAFGSEEGKRVLKDLEGMCYINKTTFSATRDRTLLNEGMRFVVVHIKNIMDMDIKTLTKLVREGE